VTWNVQASSIVPAIRKAVKAQKQRLRERSKEIGKRLSLEKEAGDRNGFEVTVWTKKAYREKYGGN